MRWLLATLQLLFLKQSRASELHLTKLCPSIATLTMFAKLLISTLELCVISSGVSTMKLHGQWLARWSGHGSTIVTRSFTERPLETSVGFRGWSTRWRGWSRVPGSVITSRQFLADLHWLSNRVQDSIQSCLTDIQNTHHEETGVSRRSTQFFRLHRDHSGQNLTKPSFMLTLLVPASPVELFVMWRRLFWNALPAHLTDVSQSLDSFKKQLKNILIQSGIPSLTVLLVRACDSIYSYLICFHWHMARHQLCIIIIIILPTLQRIYPPHSSTHFSFTNKCSRKEYFQRIPKNTYLLFLSNEQTVDTSCILIIRSESIEHDAWKVQPIISYAKTNRQ